MDVAPIHPSAVANLVYQPIYTDFNMERFDLNQALNREYNLPVVDWSVDQATDVVLSVSQYPSVIFNQPFIREKIKDFRYFRAGIRFSIRVVANQFLYGKVIAYYTPNPSQDVFNSTLRTSRRHSTGVPHVLVSAAAGEVAVLDVPFISEYRVLDINEVPIDDMGEIVVKVFNPLTSITSVVDRAQLFITTQFIDAELFMPYEDIEVQSHNSEANLKSERGTISSALESTKPLLASVKNVPIINNYARIASKLIDPAQTIMSMMGLSKPSTRDFTNVSKINPYSDFNTGKGIDCSIKLAMDPENEISTQPVCGGIPVDEMALSYIAQTPSLVKSFRFDNEEIGVVKLFDPIFNEHDSIPNTFATHMMANFAFCSGSMKLKAYIAASNFHSVRAVIYMARTIDSTIDWTNCYHRVIDIQGDTDVQFTVPYLSKRFAYGSNPSDLGIYMKLLSWSQPDPALVCPIYINVYHAVASDFRFGALLDNNADILPQCNPREDFIEEFEFFHKSFTGYSITNVLYGETYTTLREVLHRYRAYRNLGAAVNVPRYYSNESYGDNVQGLELFGMFYRFFRGSVRIKVVPIDPTKLITCYMDYNEDSFTHIFVGSALSCTTNPLLEVEVPYYNREVYQPTQAGPDSIKLVLNDTATGRFLFKAAGDDFSFHFLRLPPDMNYDTQNAALGAKGFVAFFDAPV